MYFHTRPIVPVDTVPQLGFAQNSKDGLPKAAIFIAAVFPRRQRTFLRSLYSLRAI